LNGVKHINGEQERKSEIFKGSREHASSFPYAPGPNSENTWTVVERVWLGIKKFIKCHLTHVNLL